MRLIFSTSKAFASRSIRIMDGGEASHVGIVFGRTVYDTTMKHRGVRQWDIDEWLAKDGRRVISDISITVPNEPAAESFAIGQQGKPYDVTALLGFVMWRDWSEPDAWYCSELAMAVLSAAGLSLIDRHGRIGVRFLHELANAYSGKNQLELQWQMN